MTEAELAELDDPDAPNVPAVLPGHQGPQAIVTVNKQRERRQAMSQMLQQGVSNDVIRATCERQFGMTEHAVQLLRGEVRAGWDDDDAEGARYEKAAQKRRITTHIAKAAKAGKWTAVAGLEKVYADVVGTNIHEEDKPMDVDARLTDALLAELNAQGTKEVRIMIQTQRMFIELGERDGTVVPSPKLKPGETIVEASTD